MTLSGVTEEVAAFKNQESGISVDADDANLWYCLEDKEGNIYNEISFDDFFKFTKDFSSPISTECVLFAQKHKMNIICINTDGQKVLTISF